MAKIEVLLHVKIGILEDKKVTVGNIATAIKDLGIETKIAEQIIQTIDEKEVERHCGSKYSRCNGEQRYQRAGTSNREPVTSVGKLKIKLHKIKEKEMRYALTTDERLYQLDLVHPASITGYKLWEDRIMTLEDRKTIAGKLQTVAELKKMSKEFPGIQILSSD